MIKKSNTKKSETKTPNKAAILARQRLEEIERLRNEELERQKEEERKFEEELRLENERKALIEEKRLKKEAKIKAQKEAGTYKSLSQKRKEKKLDERLKDYRLREVCSSSILPVSDTPSEIVEEDETLRAPIICVLGHVDTGKTKLLDKLRRTNIGGKEDAHITQQIGASLLPKSRIPEECQVPGFLFIDTPGHSSFGSLRSRGSKICDLAIIVIDIMHGIERQTIESIEICKTENVPFIIALNKIDLLYEWNSDFSNSQFQDLKTDIFRYFWNLELNPRLFNENQTDDEVIFVPVSAVTGEGMNDLLITCSNYCIQNIDLSIEEELDATVMELRKTSRGEVGLEVILKNGSLKIGDLIGLSTIRGRLVTEIRSIQIAEECEEMRMTKRYNSVNNVVGSCGIRILANDIEGTIPGIPLVKLSSYEEEFETFQTNIILDEEGIAIFAPSLGQLEGLLIHLRNDLKIKVAIAELGDVYKKKILQMSEFKPENKFILCFDVCLSEDARIFVGENNISSMVNSTIYKLSTAFLRISEDIIKEQKKQLKNQARIPFKLKIEESIRNSNPIILEVTVEQGELSSNIEICDQNSKIIGSISEIRLNDQKIENCSKNSRVTIAIESNLLFGRNLTKQTELYPTITRDSLNILKNNFPELIDQDMFKLIKNIKKLQNII